MKKIAIITTGTLPVPASKGGAVETLLEIFININEERHDFEVVLFSVYDDKAYDLSEKYKNSKFIFINSKTVSYKLGRGVRFVVNKLIKNHFKNKFIYEVLKFKKEFEDADMILIENNSIFAPHIRRITKKPLGLHLHNDHLNVQKKVDSINILKNLDFVVGVSKYIKDRVIEVAPKNCKVDYIYNGININRFGDRNSLTDKNALQEQYGIKNDEIVILFTGRIQESKGVKLLVESFIKLSDSYNLKLLIVGGSGFEDSKKSAFIKELELLSQSVPTKIVFTGYIKYSEVHRVYDLADFAVFPSLATEAFPLTTIEALSAGLPVIVTDAGGMPEGVDSNCGFVVKRDELLKQNLIKRMELLIVDKPVREKMAVEARKRALLFSEINYYESLSGYLKSDI